MKQHFAARLTLSAFAILLAIAPVPFEKWAWQRIAFGILGLVGVASTKTKIDEEMDEQRLVDVQVFEEKQYEKELAQVQQGLAIEAARQQEAVRFGLQTKVMTADYQGAFVTLMEEKHPHYLDALQAQQEAALQAQRQAYTMSGRTAGRVGEVLEVGAIGFETGVSLENGIQQSSVPKYLRSFVATTCLAWGAQGSGKSWFVRYLTKIKVDKGYRVIVFDPNSNHSSWKGVELINTYEAIEEKMRWYINEVQLRYQTFTQSDYDEDVWRAGLWTDGKAISVICEEVTTYADFIPDTELVKQFIKVATTLSRKQEMPVTFVTHNNTQTCFGNIKGLGQLIADMQQIKLIPKTDSETDQPVASGRAQVRSNSEQSWVDVSVPRIGSKIIDFTRTPQGSSTQNQAPVAEVNITKTIDNAAAEAQDAVDSIAHIDTQRQQLDAGYKQLNLAEYLRNETTPEELDKLIEGLRSGDTTRIDDVSDTSIRKNVSDTYQCSYRSPEALPSNESLRIWDADTFTKYLPKHDEMAMFEQLCTYQDEANFSGSEIIKKAETWKFSSGASYRRIGQPCFAYLISKYGSDKQKEHYAPFIKKCLAVNDSDSEEDQTRRN